MFAKTRRMEIREKQETCTTVPKSQIEAAEKIWNYLRIDDDLQKCDLIIGLGSHDVRVATRAAELWNEGFADYILFSGKSGVLTEGMWTKSEAEIFQDVAVKHGVPRDRILLETQSTNTGENIQFSYKLLSDLKRIPTAVILVQKPYMGRRTLATFQKQWPDKNCRCLVTSPKTTLLESPNDDVGSLNDVISVLLGDMQRIEHYANLGFQTRQHIPDDIIEAFNFLKSTKNYNHHLLAVPDKAL